MSIVYKNMNVLHSRNKNKPDVYLCNFIFGFMEEHMRAWSYVCMWIFVYIYLCVCLWRLMIENNQLVMYISPYTISYPIHKYLCAIYIYIYIYIYILVKTNKII